jgi:membrane-bound serine protease (ClpP class)
MAMLGNVPTFGDVTTAVAVLGSAVVITLAVFYAWFRHLPSSNRFKGLLLQDGLDREGGFISAPERKDLIGQTAVAVTDLRPAGTARIGDERIDVVSEGDFIASGSQVKILRAEGYRLVVRQAATE